MVRQRKSDRLQTARTAFGFCVVLYLAGLLGVAHHLSTATHHHHGELNAQAPSAEGCAVDAFSGHHHQHLLASQAHTCCRQDHDGGPLYPPSGLRDAKVKVANVWPRLRSAQARTGWQRVSRSGLSAFLSAGLARGTDQRIPAARLLPSFTSDCGVPPGCALFPFNQ